MKMIHETFTMELGFAVQAHRSRVCVSSSRVKRSWMHWSAHLAPITLSTTSGHHAWTGRPSRQPDTEVE